MSKIISETSKPHWLVISSEKNNKNNNKIAEVKKGRGQGRSKILDRLTREKMTFE